MALREHREERSDGTAVPLLGMVSAGKGFDFYGFGAYFFYYIFTDSCLLFFPLAMAFCSSNFSTV